MAMANTCCSHPRPGESVEEAAHRKLQQEMGFDCRLKEVFTFVYKAPFENGLTEYELDHVLIGHYNGDPVPNPKEAEGWKWVSIEELEKDIDNHPERYTPWFKIAIKRVVSVIR